MEYRVTELGEKTWQIEEYDGTASVYMYLLCGSRGAVLIDAGLGTIPLDEIIAGLTALPVKVLLTHGHYDHIGGSGYFHEVFLHKDDVETYHLHANEYRKLLHGYDLAPVHQSVTLMDGDSRFDLGERMIQVISTPGHSAGSVCFLDEKNHWLFTGDTCCKAHVLLHLEYSETVEEYERSISGLLDRKKDFTVTWPGHHTWPVEIQILEQFQEAARGILDGQLTGEKTEISGEVVELLTYKEIGITYRKNKI